MTEPPRPMCFVAMPFGKKAPAGKKKPLIAFDDIYAQIERAVEKEGLECVRADFEPGGGFIHRPMFERLLVAEYVVADVTLANPNVTYEIGVRHGASARPTILIGAGGDFMKLLPFDLRPLRVMPYDLADDGSLPADAAKKLVKGLRKLLRKARDGSLPVDNPIMQATAWSPRSGLEHEKTDVFLARLKYAGEAGQRVSEAVNKADAAKAVKALATLEKELVGSEEVQQLHSALLGIFLGYREKKAYRRMADLYPRLPEELKQTAVAQEQLALALNRLAEAAAKKGSHDEALELRRAALDRLDAMPDPLVSSETFGIRGRIHKGLHDAEVKAGNRAKARAALASAIEAYENGVRADMRDYYPGVNAVTLRLLRARAVDMKALDRLLPVVRAAVEYAPEAESTEERYWQAATRLELACAAKDWDGAEDELDAALGIDAEDWMHETTVKNLRIQQRAFRDDARAVTQLERYVEDLGGQHA